MLAGRLFLIMHAQFRKGLMTSLGTFETNE